MRHTMTLRAKLFACFGLILVVALATAVYSLYTVRNIRHRLRDDIELGSSRVDDTRQIALAMADMRMAMRGISLFSMMHASEPAKKAQAAFEASAGQIQQVLQHMSAGKLAQDDAKTVEQIRAGLDQWMRAFPEFASESLTGDPGDAGRKVLQKTSPVMDAMQKAAAALGHANRAQHDAGVAAVEANIDRTATVSLFITIALLISGVLAFLVVAGLVKQLKEITATVAVGAEQVASASADVSTASRSLAQGASEQAASLEETSASTEEINSVAQRNAANSQQAARLVAESGDKFVETNQSLDSMLVAMGEINASSGKISKIIKVIDEIAFQTNILALNAAVEAARAGEAGMGFAVVAEEVRNLAQRCAAAARDTTALIEESVVKSGEGKSKVDRVAQATKAVTAHSSEVKILVDEVQLASGEQARGIEQIGKAITRMGQLTQDTAASAEESAAAATELTAQSQALHEVAKQLSGIVYGAATREEAPGRN